MQNRCQEHPFKKLLSSLRVMGFVGSWLVGLGLGIAGQLAVSGFQRWLWPTLCGWVADSGRVAEGSLMVGFQNDAFRRSDSRSRDALLKWGGKRSRGKSHSNLLQAAHPPNARSCSPAVSRHMPRQQQSPQRFFRRPLASFSCRNCSHRCGVESRRSRRFWCQVAV